MLMQANLPSWQRILRQFLPSKNEILLLVVLNGALLLVVFYSLSVGKSDSVNEFQFFTKVFIFGRVFTWLHDVIGSIITANVATMILWGFIGSFVYSLISGLQMVLSGAASTFIATFLYVHPTGLTKTHYVLQMLLERLISILIFFVMVIYVWSFCASIVPFVFTGAKDSLLPLGISSFYASGYFLILSAAVHGLVVLFRLENGRYKADTL